MEHKRFRRLAFSDCSLIELQPMTGGQTTRNLMFFQTFNKREIKGSNIFNSQDAIFIDRGYLSHEGEI